jgi:hypothetical protein
LLELILVSPSDDYRITTVKELGGKFVSDATGAARNQNRVAGKLHLSGLSPQNKL